MKKFIFAKIGAGNSLAGRYLSGNSEVNFPAVPIYFDCNCDNEEQFLKDGGAKEQGELFFECGRHPDDKYIVVIHEGNVHILRPSGSVQFKKSSVLVHIPVENEHLFRFKMNADSGLRVHRFRTPQCTYSDVR
ncbi:hypothetical protein VCX22_11590 [Aeromonas caviae]|uniref:hypothetical protein n=1 Tax=Aeromonas caviae TaxID=648 RepID=UPI002B2476BE|nr:hypothetical protein [Aeromonas caviae]MEA9418123.1 hypothetical protein [Aeromonas caviae]